MRGIAPKDRQVYQLIQESVSAAHIQGGKQTRFLFYALSDERYIKMAEVYESEQKSLTVQISDDEKKLAEMKQKTTDLRLLLQTLRKCTDITELIRDLVNRLIQRVEVHNNDKYDGHCHVKVDIYFTGAGIINIPTEQDLLRLMDEIRNSRPNEQSA